MRWFMFPRHVCNPYIQGFRLSRRSECTTRSESFKIKRPFSEAVCSVASLSRDSPDFLIALVSPRFLGKSMVIGMDVCSSPLDSHPGFLVQLKSVCEPFTQGRKSVRLFGILSFVLEMALRARSPARHLIKARY